MAMVPRPSTNLRHFSRRAEAETQLASHRMRDAEQKMTWEGIQSPSDAKLTGFTRFTPDRQEWQVRVDDAGKSTTDSGSLEHKK